MLSCFAVLQSSSGIPKPLQQVPGIEAELSGHLRWERLQNHDFYDFWAFKKGTIRQGQDHYLQTSLKDQSPGSQTLPIPTCFRNIKAIIHFFHHVFPSCGLFGHPNGSPALSHTTAFQILVSLSGVPLRIEYIYIYTIFAHVPLLMNRYHSTLGTLGCRCTKPIALCRQEPS